MRHVILIQGSVRSALNYAATLISPLESQPAPPIKPIFYK